MLKMKNIDLKKIFSVRHPWVHKGQFGRVFVIGGSKTHSGSPVFNAISALRSGSDLVEIAGPERAMNITAGFLPDLITRPLDGDLNLSHISALIDIMRGFDALIIGCGLARNEESFRAIIEIMGGVDMPIVADAEAIRAIAQEPGVLKGKKVVLTPHAEEFRVLTGEVVKPDIEDRKTKVQAWAKKLGTTIVLKGSVDVISDGQEIIINETGSPFMTKGGFGDTLAGICGTLLARNASTVEAGYGAAFINGKAGELAGKKYGEGVLASDIFEIIPEVITEMKE